MKKNIALIVLGLSLGFGAAAQDKRSYTGVITDTMCGATHNMGITPDDKCVRECVRSDPKKWKYALRVGTEVYALSDQQSPSAWAGRRVKVTGTLYPKTKILNLLKIEAAQ